MKAQDCSQPCILLIFNSVQHDHIKKHIIRSGDVPFMESRILLQTR